jgi:putative Holliday junction resolvase
MTHHSYIGFDYGQKYLGLATGQSITGTAQPLTTIQMLQGKPNWPAIEAIIHEWQPNALIVGIALQPDGAESKLSKLARKFGATLQQKFKRPVHFIDERLTSVAARERLGVTSFPTLKQKREIDRISAAIILESWLNSVKYEG